MNPYLYLRTLPNVKRLILKFYSTVLLFSTIQVAQAQPQYDFQSLKAAHEGENAVIVKNDRLMHIGVAKGELSIQSTQTLGFTILEENARISSEHEVSYSPGFYTISDISAASYVLQSNGKYKKIKVKNFEDYSDYSGYVFYDDTRHKKFYFPSLKAGTYAEETHTYDYARPQFLGGHYFQPGSWAVLDSKLTVEVEDGVEIAWSQFGDKSLVNFTQTTEKGKTIYQWELKDAPARKYFNDAPNSRYYIPHIYIRIKSYSVKGQSIPVLGDLNDLYRFNYSFIKDVNDHAPSADIQNVVDSLKRVNSNTDSMIQNIFYWVQSNIKYIAIEDGLGGYVPRQANDIFTNRYGDCKDKTSIITCMLNAANIPSHMVWIGSRDIPYRYEDLPTPSVDNHMIAAVFRHGRWIFLDGTAGYYQYGYPTNFIQGKEGLVAIDPDSFSLVQVPVIPASENLYSDTMNLWIENGMLKAKGHVQVNKMQKFRITESLMNMKDEDRTKRLEDLNRKGNNKCKIDKMDVHNLEERNEPLKIDYTMHIPDYVKDIDNNLYINMWLSKSYLDEKIDTSQRGNIPKEINYTYTDLEYYVLDIPEGYRLKPSSLPENVEYHSGKVNVSYSYKHENNKVYFQYQIAIDTLLITPDQFKDYNEAIDILLKAYNQVIVLEKVKP
ncbi:MAG: DUF3857 domain-containing protein [Bacteroidetes bacterium]|nr:DUF3857 domain-containing protein [Bacteroidota bacterium]